MYYFFFLKGKSKELDQICMNCLHLQRSEGGGAFEAVDMLNGELLCGCDDVHACEALRLR